jgi:hypothetical protein
VKARRAPRFGEGGIPRGVCPRCLASVLLNSFGQLRYHDALGTTEWCFDEARALAPIQPRRIWGLSEAATEQIYDAEFDAPISRWAAVFQQRLAEALRASHG